MDFLTALTQFATWIRPYIPNLITANRDLRGEIRGVVNELCTALTDGLDLVLMRLRAARRIDDVQKRADYLAQSENELFKSFSEFKICADLRSLEDRLKSLFDPVKAAVNISTASEFTQLITALEDYERIVFDMIQATYSKLHNALNPQQTQPSPADLDQMVADAIADCEQKRKTVTDLGRSIIDTM
ncbi:MAG TPA: hypothetical protein VII34_03755 [Pyrinomonadaceae bacterium]